VRIVLIKDMAGAEQIKIVLLCQIEKLIGFILQYFIYLLEQIMTEPVEKKGTEHDGYN
jgi:hypothetical protein